MTIRFAAEGPTTETHDSGFCDRNLNLLAHAQAIELDIGSRCGGHGVCGGDRVRIPPENRDRMSPVTEDEKRHLSQAEIDSGLRLACQCFPERSGIQCNVRYFPQAAGSGI